MKLMIKKLFMIKIIIKQRDLDRDVFKIISVNIDLCINHR